MSSSPGLTAPTRGGASDGNLDPGKRISPLNDVIKWLIGVSVFASRSRFREGS